MPCVDHPTECLNHKVEPLHRKRRECGLNCLSSRKKGIVIEHMFSSYRMRPIEEV
jgi:hypothetical protein